MALIDSILVDASPVSKNNLRQYLSEREAAGYWWPTVFDMVEDTGFSYSSGARKIIAGQSVSAGAYLYEVAASSASDHDLTTSGGVKLYIADDMITPYHFGAIGDDATDDGPAINAFFAKLGGSRHLGKIVGSFKSAEPILISASDLSEAVSKTIICDAVITSDYTDINGTLVTIENWRHASFLGRLWAVCGEIDLGTRRQRHGISVRGNFRTHFEYLRGMYSIREGIITRGASADSINNNVTSHGLIGAFGCGYIEAATVSSFSNTGSADSAVQRTVITPSAIPTHLTTTDLISHDGKDYQVMAIDTGAGTVTVYPWVVGLSNSDPIDFKVGGGVHMTGNDNNIGTIGRVDVSACPWGLKLSMLFGPVIQSVHYNSNGAHGGNNGSALAYPLFSNPASQMRGGSIGSLYVETTFPDAQIVCTSIAQTNFAISVMDGEAAGLGKVRQLVPAGGSSGSPAEGHSQQYKGTINYNGVRYGPSGSMPRNYSASSQTISNRKERWHRHRNAQVFVLEWDDAANRLFGNDSMLVSVTGTGSGGAPSGTISFSASGGATVNGSGSPVDFTTLTKPGLWLCVYVVADDNWIVSMVSGL